MGKINNKNLGKKQLVSIRDLDKHSESIKRAMMMYNTTVASKMFVQAMLDAPVLKDELDESRKAYNSLLQEHESLKRMLRSYFELGDALKDIIKKEN